MIFIVIVVAALCVAYANGSNDNFKGVATLFGSGTTDYRKALSWATVTTLLGSVAALLLAGSLIKSFGGKGLIDDAIAAQPQFAASVALAAGATVLIASRLGMPVSTTHSLMGALLGTGLFAGSAVNVETLSSKFMIPLLTSPIIAVIVTSLLYPLLRWLRVRSGVTSEYCLCIGSETVEVVPAVGKNCQLIAFERAEKLTASIGQVATCQNRYSGSVMGMDAASTLDRAHFLSSGMVSFARGLNDTPKMAAMLLLAPMFEVTSSLIAIGLMIAAGGLISARRVAETMSNKITAMNHGQGFTANVVTGLIVIGASRFGLPVSTTHVSCGSLFGLGAVTGGARVKAIVTILLSWVATLPLAAVFGVFFYLLLSAL